MKWIVAIRRDIGKHFQVTTHTRVCSRHFKPLKYLPSLAGRKRTLKLTAVPSVHWKKRSPVKRKAPTRRSPIKRKKATEKTTTKLKLIYQRVTPRAKYFWSHRKLRFSRQSQKIWKNTTVDQPANDSQSIIRDIQVENESTKSRL